MDTRSTCVNCILQDLFRDTLFDMVEVALVEVAMVKVAMIKVTVTMV